MTVVNLLLIVSFILTAFCGMSMSGYAVPFLYGMAPVSFARRMHLSMSHWSFVLMGLHLGIHIPVMTAHFKWKDRTRNILICVFAFIAGIGLYVEWEDEANVRSAVVRYTDLSSSELARMQIRDRNLYSIYTTPDHLAPLGVVGYLA